MILVDTCSFYNISLNFIKKKIKDALSNRIAISSCAFGNSSVFTSISSFISECMQLLSEVLMHATCKVFIFFLDISLYLKDMSPNRIRLGPNNLQNVPSKNEIIYTHFLYLRLL